MRIQQNRNPVESNEANLALCNIFPGEDGTPTTISTLFRTQSGAVRAIGPTDRRTWAATQRRTGAVASTTMSALSTSRLGPRNSAFTIVALTRPCIALATTGNVRPLASNQLGRRC